MPAVEMDERGLGPPTYGLGDRLRARLYFKNIPDGRDGDVSALDAQANQQLSLYN